MKSFKTWLLEQGKLRYNPLHVQLAKTIASDTCCTGTSYEQIAAHRLNEHALTLEEADALYHAGTRYANAVNLKHPIEHIYALT